VKKMDGKAITNAEVEYIASKIAELIAERNPGLGNLPYIFESARKKIEAATSES
jgi:hypothetical protein